MAVSVKHNYINSRFIPSFHTRPSACRTSHVTMLMNIHHQLLLLLLLLLCAANLPSCWSSHFVFRRPRYFKELREARRSAYMSEPGGFRRIDTSSQFVKKMLNTAAHQADVTATVVIQAFFNVRLRSMLLGIYKSILLTNNTFSELFDIGHDPMVPYTF